MLNFSALLKNTHSYIRLLCRPTPHRNFWTCWGTFLCLWHVILTSGPGEGLDWHWFERCLHWILLSCTEILEAWDDPSLDICPIWPFQEEKFFLLTKSLVWDCLLHVAAWVLTLWWSSMQQDSVPQRSSSPKSNHLSSSSWSKPYPKTSSEVVLPFLCCPFRHQACQVESFGFVFVGKVNAEEHKVRNWDLRGFAAWISCEPGSDKLLKGQIPKGRLWICHTCPVWCERKGVAVLQAQAFPDATWISVSLVPILEFNLHPVCSGISLHLSVCFV